MSLAKQLVPLAKPYYWVNILLSISYLLAKKLPFTCSYLFRASSEEMCELDMRETEILFFLLIVVMIRSRKTGSVTMINYLSSSFLYTKVANVILWAYSDFRYGSAFLLVCVVISMLLPEPTYKGPEHIIYFRNAQTFEEEVARDKRINWLICFYTIWSPSCVHFAPIFAELSAEYHLDNLKFAKIDVGRFPDMAAKFRIDVGSFSRQLPTVILFQNGKEVGRRPDADAKGKLQKFFFSADNMRVAFSLNTLYKQCVEKPLKPLSAGAAKVESKKSK